MNVAALSPRNAFIVCFVLFSSSLLAQLPPKLYSVLASAEAKLDPPQLTLSWPGDTNATNYVVSRKAMSADVWTELAALGGDATGFVDRSVDPFTRYEYQIVKKARPGYAGYGYLCGGIEAPALDQLGTVILIVADTYAQELAAELSLLQSDLTGDGWMVLRHDVPSSGSVTNVKELIRADYAADPANVRAVFLFGAVPVPYSGAIAPDGHTNHFGAWPADVYYGELQGQWTDSSVTATNAEKQRNWNVPGDGKFDQSVPPGEVILQVGRVDLSGMTAFSNKNPPRSERDLLRQYLQKDHNFRHGLLQVKRQALICDNFTDKGSDPVGGSAWRNFSGFFGSENIIEVGWSNYFANATNDSFLWSFGSGGGQFYTCTGVGSSDDFALQDIRVVFTMWLGSHFGDWDNESNFLRAPLGSTSYTLTSSYSGFPQWLYHPMALGQTAGCAARLTQNNRPGGLYPPFNQGTNQVHIALLGDPTLRMHPVLPPSDLVLTALPEGVKVSWKRSSDTDLRGCHVYRAASAQGPFRRLTANGPVSGQSFVDAPPAGSFTYMLRAVKLETSASGTYLNLSQGIFGSISISEVPSSLKLSIRSKGLTDVELAGIGRAGQTAVLEASNDLIGWSALSTNTVRPDGSVFWDTGPLLGNQHRFFRGRPE